MMEAGVLIDLDGHPIYWHTPNDRSGGALPDSRSLWDVIWENRDRISGFAHTHSGYGRPGPSQTDITTFAAIEAALGKRLHWWISSGDQVVRIDWIEYPDEKGGYQLFQTGMRPPKPAWLAELRRISGFPV